MPGRNLGFRVEIFGFGHRFRVETIGPSFGFPDRNSQVPDLGFRIETVGISPLFKPVLVSG